MIPYSSGGSRRSSCIVYCDILLALAERSRSRIELARVANLNKRTFEKYVERGLVSMGYVKKKWIGRQIMYMITRRGRFYLGMLAYNPEVASTLLAKDNLFAARVARELERYGVEVAFRGEMYADTEVEPPVDIVVRHDGRSALVLVAATRAGLLLKLSYAALLSAMARTREQPIYVLVPRSMEAASRSNGVVSVLYPDEDAAAAAEELLKAMAVLVAEPPLGAAAGRVIRI